MQKKSHHPHSHQEHKAHSHEHHEHHQQVNEQHAEHASSSSVNESIQHKINENLVHLQKVHLALIEKFDSLSAQLTSLLGLFEVAAKSFVNNPANQTSEKDKELMEKIEKIVEQNRTLARGVTLLEEKMREQRQHMYEPLSPVPLPPPSQQSPAFMPIKKSISPKLKETESNDEEAIYEPSINKPLPKF